jgi:hypothetical protein
VDGEIMTGVALGLAEITKIAVGNTEVAKVSLGTDIVWPPPVPVPPEYAASWTSIAASQQCSIAWFGSSAFPAGVIQAQTANQSTLVLNTHPFSWPVGPAFSSFWVRPTIIQSGIQSTGQLLLGVPAGVWTEIGPFDAFGVTVGVGLNILGAVVDGKVRVELSLAANGGNIVYDAVSTFNIRRTS